jgi:hypothetical protein
MGRACARSPLHPPKQYSSPLRNLPMINDAASMWQVSLCSRGHEQSQLIHNLLLACRNQSASAAVVLAWVVALVASR